MRDFPHSFALAYTHVASLSSIERPTVLSQSEDFSAVLTETKKFFIEGGSGRRRGQILTFLSFWLKLALLYLAPLVSLSNINP